MSLWVLTCEFSWDKWIDSIKSNPDIIYYKLRPIHEVVTWSDTKSANLARALTEYSNEAVAFDQGRCFQIRLLELR